MTGQLDLEFDTAPRRFWQGSKLFGWTGYCYHKRHGECGGVRTTFPEGEPWGPCTCPCHVVSDEGSAG